MADFLGKLKGKIDRGISTVNVKSKELIGKQKIKLQVSEVEAEKKNILLEIGKLTHLMVDSSEAGDIPNLKETIKTTKSKELKPDKWEQAVLSVITNICSGKTDKILFENTETEFKITAKSLLAEVQKSLPKSEQKGQNLQWLGRVLGKFGITSRKFSKRINGERETVYEFDKDKTLKALNTVKGAKSKTGSNKSGSSYREQILTKSKEITKLDAKISKLQEQLSQIGV